MRGHNDLTWASPPTYRAPPGLLPLDIDRVSRVVRFLNFQATTDLAVVRVLTGTPASAATRWA
ncbi:hypothetical protein [Nocardioides zeae]|uniref:Uncharacterized protein n=1 Tax=Nocardioides zeae TaxID=1457234 RepID=A0A6P0HEG1_9ACTN|nr:hypothetical protein [Nocardioides zeae]NEN77132.1 hypothetical protein [Nocardioides zeae]